MLNIALSRIKSSPPRGGNGVRCLPHKVKSCSRGPPVPRLSPEPARRGSWEEAAAGGRSVSERCALSSYSRWAKTKIIKCDSLVKTAMESQRRKNITSAGHMLPCAGRASAAGIRERFKTDVSLTCHFAPFSSALWKEFRH